MKCLKTFTFIRVSVWVWASGFSVHRSVVFLELPFRYMLMLFPVSSFEISLKVIVFCRLSKIWIVYEGSFIRSGRQLCILLWAVVVFGDDCSMVGFLLQDNHIKFGLFSIALCADSDLNSVSLKGPLQLCLLLKTNLFLSCILMCKNSHNVCTHDQWFINICIFPSCMCVFCLCCCFILYVGHAASSYVPAQPYVLHISTAIATLTLLRTAHTAVFSDFLALNSFRRSQSLLFRNSASSALSIWMFCW